MKDAVIFGPFVGEMYWEAGRFAPMLPYYKLKKYRKRDVKFIIYTRQERFDLYGKFADILNPLRIEGDYVTKIPECFRLIKYNIEDYNRIIAKVRKKYSPRFNILEHIYPDIRKGKFVNKNQFHRKNMIFNFQPRQANYDLVNGYLPKDKPLVVLASRFRKGFKRNWKSWPKFYDHIWNDGWLRENYNFIICGKKGEYIPDEKDRFLDMNKINLTTGNASLVGLLLVILENAVFTFGSQSAIPNLSLLYKVPVLEFGCQRALHTRTYNVHNTEITFIDNKRYDINSNVIFGKFKRLLKQRRK